MPARAVPHESAGARRLQDAGFHNGTAWASKSFHKDDVAWARPIRRQQTEASDRACRSMNPARRCGDWRGRDERHHRGGGNVSRRTTFLTGSPAPRVAHQEADFRYLG